MALKDEIIADLTTELQIVDPEFNSAILELKVDYAIKRVILARKYPDGFTDEMIEKDLEKFYSNIRDIALYYYNKVGADFEEQYTSNEITRKYVNESRLFKGVTPFCKL